MKLTKLLSILKTLRPSLCTKIIWALMCHPIIALPSLWASIKAQHIADDLYQNSSNGIGNAFKHAIWNMLIAHYTKFYLTEEKALRWAKKFTDLHEECVQNNEMDFLMDTHNNKIGRLLYQTAMANQHISTQQLIDFAKNKAEVCVYLRHKKFLVNYPYDLVFVS